MFTFKKPKNELEMLLKLSNKNPPNVPDEMYVSCPACKLAIVSSEILDNYKLCPKCNHHFKMNARQRLDMICDDMTFLELDSELKSQNILGFPEYDKKLQKAMLDSGENDGVVTGTACISGIKVGIFVMDSSFMMGSMGCIVGEKITRLFELAIKDRLPVIGYTVSGGARMQEGILSLMQMAKTAGVIKKHNEQGLLYIPVLTNPTTGGVTASFAMLGDIILAEPNALICFAGPRVIEQTTKQKLPKGFQRAEFLIEKGFIDAIIGRKEQKDYLAKLLRFHDRGDI